MNPQYQAFKHMKRNLSGGARLRTTAGVSKRMGQVRQRDTGPEVAVRRAATACALRYRLRNNDLPGSPDLANRNRKFAVFVHGCFWHRHPSCPKATLPKSNRAFWIAKFARNVQRDQRVIRSLQRCGFRVIVIWECDTGDLRSITRRLAGVIGR